MIYNYFKSGIDCYNKLGGNYFIEVGEEIKGDTFESLEEWNRYPYKDKIMKEANYFKYYLRTLKEKKPWYYPSPSCLIGRCSNRIITPIYHTCSLWDIDDFIFSYEECINGEQIGIPKSLIDTDLGRNILEELKETKFSEYVFCHNALYYKSFVVKIDQLIGIRNWKYSGFYPSEFEDVIQKYLEYI
jgi:hypothetical protein